MVNAACGDQALFRSIVFRWYGRFRDGREDIEDDPRSGRPTGCRNDNNVEKISQLLLHNCHLSLRMLADEVNIGKDTVRKIVVEDTRKREICSRFVPHSLILEQKDRRIVACRDLIATADSDTDFFKKIVTGDETWCFAYDRTTKRQSAAWAGETSPRPKKKIRFLKSRVKTVLVIFFDWQGVVHKELVPGGEIINAVYYKGVMERLVSRIRRVGPDMCESGDWLICTTTPSPTTRQSSNSFWPNEKWLLDPPPYSPDLAPADYFLFQIVKSHCLSVRNLWLDFGDPDSRDKHIKHNCKGRLLQRHPEAVWTFKSVCTVTSYLCRKLNNKSVISFTQILFIMSVIKLSRRTVYVNHTSKIAHLEGMKAFGRVDLYFLRSLRSVSRWR